MAGFLVSHAFECPCISEPSPAGRRSQRDPASLKEAAARYAPLLRAWLPGSRHLISGAPALLFWAGFSVALFSAPLSLASDTRPLYDQFTLPNGMEVVLVENHRVPAVSHMLWFKAGSADDPAGKSGLAHYVEHMMFQGTKTRPAGAYAKKVASLGGAQNAFTARDYTAYYVNIAKANLPKIMALEADRMQHLAPATEQFAKEREVIIEERRMRIENEPAALLMERLQAALFLNHPYRIPVIGWQEEMATLEWTDIEPFWRAHYQPKNAVLAVAGDITRRELETWAMEFYGSIPNQKELPPRIWKAEPAPLAARRIAMEHALAGEPLWVRAYTAPSLAHGDTKQAMPLTLLSQLLGGGATATLYQSLVVRQKLSVSVNADYNGLSRGPGSFTISAVPAPGVSFAKLEAAIEKEIANARKRLPDAADLTRAKTQLKAEILYARDGLQNLAMLFGQLRALGLPASLFGEWPAMIARVTADEVRSAAEMVLKPDHSVTATLTPKPGAAGGKPVPGAIVSRNGDVR